MMRTRSLAALVSVALGTAPLAARAAESSLCSPRETVIFTCPIGAKLVSVCAAGGGTPVYRFGTPEKPELELQGLETAEHGYSGGGEDQIIASNGGWRYVVYSRAVRTGFGPDAHNDTKTETGLVVQHDGGTVSDKRCATDFERGLSQPSIQALPKAAYVAH